MPASGGKDLPLLLTMHGSGNSAEAQAWTSGMNKLAGEEAGDAGFEDVAKDKYYYKAVNWAAAHGIVSGTSKTTFSPDAKCTRAQIATFLYQAYGEERTYDTSDFTDIDKDDYYYNAVNWAAENDITAGTGEGIFQPDGFCTRAQAVTMLYKAAKQSE